jgi:hypothetical protein
MDGDHLRTGGNPLVFENKDPLVSTYNYYFLKSIPLICEILMVLNRWKASWICFMFCAAPIL